jgi:hypothetical protein
MKMELVACEILQISIVLYSVLLECLFESVTEASHPRRETNKVVSKKINNSIGLELRESADLTWPKLLFP